MPGSAVNLSDCNMMLNTAMAEELKDFADAMEGKAGDEFEAAAIAYIKETLKKHQRIIFNGNGYSDEWPTEAERRGLANHRTTADALPCLRRARRASSCSRSSTCSPSWRLRSRYEVKLEKYNKLLNIEVAHHEAHGAPRATCRPSTGYAADGRRHRDHRHQGRLRRAPTPRSQEQLLQTRSSAGIKEIDVRAERARTGRTTPPCEIADEQERANEYAHAHRPHHGARCAPPWTPWRSWYRPRPAGPCPPTTTSCSTCRRPRPRARHGLWRRAGRERAGTWKGPARFSGRARVKGRRGLVRFPWSSHEGRRARRASPCPLARSREGPAPPSLRHVHTKLIFSFFPMPFASPNPRIPVIFCMPFHLRKRLFMQVEGLV